MPPHFPKTNSIDQPTRERATSHFNSRDTQGITAIIWDYDGTLVDSREKNFAVTKKIVSQMSDQGCDSFALLQSKDAYVKANEQSTNWRELYYREFGFSHEQVELAGRMWTTMQLADETPITIFPGIRSTLDSLHEHKAGIVSQNSKQNIQEVLKSENLEQYFDCVIGYEEVELSRQKPAPDGLLLCIEQLTGFEEGNVFYVGDHEADVLLVQNTNRILAGHGHDVRVWSVGARYSTGSDGWTCLPDFELQAADDLIRLVDRFPSS